MKQKTVFSDTELIAMIKEESLRTEALAAVYRSSAENIRKLVRKYGGSKDEVNAVASEALVVLVQSIVKDKFRAQSSLRVFFIGICKTIWRNELLKKQKQRQLHADWEVEPQMNDLVSDHIEKRESIAQLERKLARLGEICQQIIRWRFYEEKALSWKEIGQKLGYENDQVARNKGQKCMKKLRSFFISKKEKGAAHE